MANRQGPFDTGGGGPEEKTARINRSAVIVGATITAVAGLLTAIISVANSSHGASAPSTSATALSPALSSTVQSQSPTGSTAGCLSKLMMTSPTSGQHVSGAAGVQVSGAACGLANEYGWVFDRDTDDHYYYEVYPNNPGPLVLQNGPWTVLDQPIGSPGDSNKTYFVALVLASSACNTALLNMPQIDGDYKVLTFPVGCQVVQEVNVSVTYAG
jgi:hypothetical protein